MDSNRQAPLISIIMPNFNGGKYLIKAIESFLSQDYLNKELVIVDGKSTDNSHSILEQYSKNNSNIIWSKFIDKGISNAFNNAIDLTKGEIIGYMGSDDQLYKGVFNEISYACSWCNFDAVYFNSYSYLVKDNKCTLRKCPSVEFSKQNLLEQGTIVGWQDIFFKREIYKKYRYDDLNKTCMDYEFYLRISKEKYLYLYIDKIATINTSDGNISSDVDGKQFSEACQVTNRYMSNYDGKVYFRKEDIVQTRQVLKTVIKRLLNKILTKIG